MISDMVEPVARAIYDTMPTGVREWADAPELTRLRCLTCARAAIEAMREPTEAVLEAARAAAIEAAAQLADGAVALAENGPALTFVTPQKFAADLARDIADGIRALAATTPPTELACERGRAAHARSDGLRSQSEGAEE